MRPALLSLLVLCVACPALASPSEVAAAATADCATMRADARLHARYLSLAGVPEKQRPAFLKILAVHVNHLSGGAELVAPEAVRPDLVRVDVRAYDKRFAVVWEELAATEPYYHVLASTTAASAAAKPKAGKLPKGKLPGKAKAPAARAFKADRLAVPEVAKLIDLTGSKVPLVRADWFFRTTAVQAERGKVGYYEWHGLKNRGDFFKLIGFNKGEAQRLKREVAAIVLKSGVARYPRQAFRYGAVDSGYYVTLDVLDSSTGKRNAVRFLDNDYEHQAEEHIGVLPNRLFAYYLSDNKGVQQDSAPDKIGPDSTSTSNDPRIHAYLSCVRCHVEGLRPLTDDKGMDHGRLLYSPPLALQDPDYDRLLRLRQLYLGPILPRVERDVADYGSTVKAFVGLKPADLSKGYRDAWLLANDADVTLEQAALEVGCPPEKLKGALLTQLKLTGKLDPVLAGYIRTPPLPATREQWEEAYQVALLSLKGVAP